MILINVEWILKRYQEFFMKTLKLKILMKFRAIKYLNPLF